MAKYICRVYRDRLSSPDKCCAGDKSLTDQELAELIDYLPLHPRDITDIYVHNNRLTDEIGVKLARYVAASSTIEVLQMSGNQFGIGTHLAMADALRINTSLRCLAILDCKPVSMPIIDSMYLATLRLNPLRPPNSYWGLYARINALEHLKQTANELGHPTLQELLLGRYLGDNRDALLKKRNLK